MIRSVVFLGGKAANKKLHCKGVMIFTEESIIHKALGKDTGSIIIGATKKGKRANLKLKVPSYNYRLSPKGQLHIRSGRKKSSPKLLDRESLDCHLLVGATEDN